MAHTFYREDGTPFTLEPIEVKCEPISQDFYECLEAFGEKVKKIHPAERMLAELEALHG